jgi:hypothetical protein
MKLFKILLMVALFIVASASSSFAKPDANGVDLVKVVKTWPVTKVIEGGNSYGEECVIILYNTPDRNAEVKRVRAFFGKRSGSVEYDYFKDGKCWTFEIGEDAETYKLELPDEYIDGCLDCHKEEMRNQRGKGI